MMVVVIRSSTDEIVWSGSLQEYQAARDNGKFWVINVFETRFIEQ